MQEKGCLLPDDLIMGYDKKMLNYLNLAWNVEKNFKKFTILHKFFKISAPKSVRTILN